MPAEFDLLADLEAEKHTFLLESGNLIRKSRPAQTSNWTGENSFTSLGYVAHIQQIHCRCGNHYSHFIGMFHREQAPSGAIRDQALTKGFQIPATAQKRVETSYFSTAVCPACLPALGFLPLKG